ncbi:cytochrome c [Marinobacter persicus]|jgi:hypothetical protein|uniref:Cytochrome c n=1 Tax=Marinobacter persicus TaxID=930118 RepID=A0A2S6G5R6_9GAMM|nr:cytochrome c [Marinobacter persicus]PPK50378.1 cytochrome c' [Marinobacter persicus]PPK54460.1 cytochrome c' [Marinobacter persicus]PPK57581.1 cytochrome c' [Marinobacter persicus]
MASTTGKYMATFLLGLAVSTSSLAAEPVTPKLTDKLSRLLQEEMRSVQTAMGTIHSGMVMGQHEAVATNAQKIHDSFILQQKLTDQDRKDLMSAVPKGFIKLDKEFHKLAASLAEAGKNQNTAEQREIFDKMTGNCIQCHSQYVSDRFPGVNTLGK